MLLNVEATVGLGLTNVINYKSAKCYVEALESITNVSYSESNKSYAEDYEQVNVNKCYYLF